MSYHYLKNLKEKKVHKSDNIAGLGKQKPKFSSKAEFREWCADSATDHVFYSMVEGDNPSLRITSDNPPNAIHGVAADYDAPVDWDVVDKIIAVQCKGLLPTWRSRTESGYLRLVWEFPSRMPITPEMFPTFMKRMAAYLSLDRLFAGFDTASLKSNQYFELGEEWIKVGDPLPENTYQTILLKAAMDKPPQAVETSIPIEEVAEEVLKRFPDRWETEFTVGSRGPLFWIDDGIDREGCQVTEDGMICYSDRAGKGFVTWREILGKQFVEDYETKKIGGLIDNYWFNGKYYYKLLFGTAQQIPKEQVVMELRKAGFSPKPKKGQPLSEVENAILSICNDNRIDEIAPVIFSDERVVSYNSHRILNNANLTPVQPADDGDPSLWPFLNKWMSGLFINGDRPTIQYFYAWLKRFYTALINKESAQGQALLLVGPTNKGKTLLSNRVIAALVGGWANASDYVSGQTSFNKDLARVAAWCIDDTTSAASFTEQRKATEMIKKCVANPHITYQAKYCDEVSLPWCGRIIMSLNMDANSLSVIPALDSSNRDKLMALQISKDSMSKFPPNVELEEIIKNELPHFAKWLLDWEVPKEVQGASRFGVISYIDKTIASAAYDNSSRSSIAELVEFFVKRAREYYTYPTWQGSLTEFQVAIHEFNGGKNVGMSNSLEFVRRGMLVLEDASRNSKSVRPVTSEVTGAGKIWTIDLSEKFDIDKGVTHQVKHDALRN